MLIRLKMKEIIYQQKGNQMTHEKHKLIHVNVYIYIDKDDSMYGCG